MGKCETATASLGIKILLSALMDQLTESNFDLIKDMLCTGFIEDDNDYYNDVYDEIIRHDTDYLTLSYSEFKAHMISEFTQKGSYFRSRYSDVSTPCIRNGCLLEKHLLVPMKDILTTERWGYDRCGANGSACQLDMDSFTLNTLKYKDLSNYEVVFMLKQT